MSALKYWLWLSSLRLLGSAKVFALIDHFGTPENVYFSDDDDIHKFPALTKNERSELLMRDLDAAERIMEQCERESLRVLTLQDADYPERLKNIQVPPSVLYVKGRMPVIDEEAALAVVGSRKATPYGLQVSARMGYSLARAGMLVVSGLANGVDAQAHTGALQAGAPTVAVLGCGVDVVYPASNRALYDDVAATGALVSEYPPGTRALGANFPVRNRILSGLSLGVLVIEAPQLSGALITVSHALEQGRDIFAVPGNIDSPESAGCNRLLREGAQLVTGPLDILQEYAALFPHKIVQKYERQQSIVGYNKKAQSVEQSTAALAAEPVMRPVVSSRQSPKSDGQPQAFDLTEAIKDFTADGKAIMIAIAGTARHVDEIVEISGLPASRILCELTMLELSGAVRQLPGSRFECTLGLEP